MPAIALARKMRDGLSGRWNSSERGSPCPSKNTCRNPSAAPKTTAVRQKKYATVTSGMGSPGLSIRNMSKIARPGRGTHLRCSRHSFKINAFMVSAPKLSSLLNVIIATYCALARFEDLRAVGCRRGVQATAVFTRVACDHAGAGDNSGRRRAPAIAAARASGATRPSQRRSPTSAQPMQRAAGKGIAAGQQPAANRTGRCRQHDQGDVAGNQSAWGHFKRWRYRGCNTGCSQGNREARASGCFPSERASERR